MLRVMNNHIPLILLPFSTASSYLIFFYNIPLKVFPYESAIFQQHISVVGVFLRYRNRARVYVCISPSVLTGRHVGMPCKNYGTLRQTSLKQAVYMVTVGGIYCASVGIYKAVVSKYRKFQHHLVYLGIAVATDTEYFFFYAVEQCYYRLWVVVTGQFVAWSVVEYISQKEKLVRIFCFFTFQQLFAIIFRAVYVGGYHKFHSLSTSLLEFEV